ncbi:hypothetical protein, partial [Lonsdalea populi]|uniref:hypothetical protein n=1 Tax=Lonsdalea populi TaxID=1172565 RepID=UPI001C654E8F
KPKAQSQSPKPKAQSLFDSCPLPTSGSHPTLPAHPVPYFACIQKPSAWGVEPQAHCPPVSAPLISIHH